MSAPHATTTIAAIAQGVIVGFGLLGNALVIFVFVMGRDKQDNSSVIYIINLAVADFLYLLSVPFSISAEVTLGWIFGDAICKIGTLFLYLNFLVSPLFLMVMSIDRCVSVYRAVASVTFRSTRVAKRISAGVWIVGLAIVTAPAMFSKVNYLNKCEPVFPGKPLCDFISLDSCLFGNTSEESCMTTKSNSFRLWNYFGFFLNYLIPCVVMVACYAALLRHIYQPSAISTSTSSGGGMNDERKKRATLVVALLVITYFLCFTPYYVWQIVLNIGVNVSNETICSHVRRITMTLAHLNSALNPILYPFIGNQFRAKLKLALRRLRRKTRNSKLGTMKKVSLRRRHTDSSRNKARLENDYNNDNYVIREIDEQELIECRLDEARVESSKKAKPDNGRTSNGSGGSSAHTPHKATIVAEASSGCLSCFRNDSYVCPECMQEKGDYRSGDVTDDENQPSGNETDENLSERLKLCKKHRNSEATSSAMATAKQSLGRWRYASTIRSELATEVSSAGVNL